MSKMGKMPVKKLMLPHLFQVAYIDFSVALV